jgi:CubicO group peptidase (beta-lactamase class C family)
MSVPVPTPACPPVVGAPGLQYVAVSATQILEERYQGAADLRAGRAMDVATTLMAYSMSTTLTAAAALILVDAGRVGLDAAIDRHLPGPPYAASITVRWPTPPASTSAGSSTPRIGLSADSPPRE